MEQLDMLMEAEDLTWKDILCSVLKGMNPWDVDLVELATRYSMKVDEMREMNFRLPANVVLVSSVLLRMKADIIAPQKPQYDDMSCSLNFIFNSDYPISALIPGDTEPYPIAIRPARLMERKVTANELIEAIQDALVEKTRTLERVSINTTRKAMTEREEPTELVLEEEVDIVQIIENTYGFVMDKLSKNDHVLFSELAKTRDEILNMFISLLHLSNTERLKLRQEELYGEIYISC
jgi:segregation and condensation protein A